jgi:phosphinothricin acetyltransferase
MVGIRLAKESDAEAVAAIYAPYVERTAVSFETVPPPPDEMRRRIGETTEVWPWLVCDTGDRIAGYAYATQHRVRAAYRWSVDTAVYVSDAHHRRGVGRGLYASLFEILRAQGFFNAYAGITLPNAASVGLHEAVGFTRVGVYRDAGYKMGSWHDVGWWELGLGVRAESPGEPARLPIVLKRPDWLRLVESGVGRVRVESA